MRSFVAIACLVAVVTPAFGAEDQPGLDLSQPPKKDAQKGQDEELPPLDLSKPAQPPAKAAPAQAEQKPAAFQPFSEKDVALGEKVKAVQKKGFLKKGRFELEPVFAATVNDAFYEKFGYGARLAYNVQDSLAVAVRGARYVKYRTDNVREGKLAFQSQLVSADIEQQVMLDGIWSPIYGKSSFLANSIIHFDLYLAAGFGLVWSSTSGAPLNQGPHWATDLGGGLRFYPKEWLAFDLGLMATLYPDQPVPLLPATVQKVFTGTIGVSIFFPTSFEYTYP